YSRRCLSRRIPTSPASRSTFRCKETACWVISKWAAISVTGRGWSRTRRKIARRCGSARALSAASVDITAIMPQPGPARQVAACTSEGLYIGCGPSSPPRPGQETEMPSFRHTIDIAATPEQVWRVLGDLTSVARWIPGVTKVARTDTGRVCTFDDGHVQNEQILDYSPQTHSYRYTIDGAPLPVRDNTGRFTVEHADGHARVI